jgi:hypothetical protein
MTVGRGDPMGLTPGLVLPGFSAIGLSVLERDTSYSGIAPILMYGG